MPEHRMQVVGDRLERIPCGLSGCAICHPTPCALTDEGDRVGGLALPPKVDIVNHPPHYTSHPSGVECITVTEHMGFCLGNAVKYLWRADLKNGVEDLEKAVWYIQREITKRKAAK